MAKITFSKTQREYFYHPTGIPSLDYKFFSKKNKGIPEGIVLLSANPANFKTTLAVDIATRIAVNPNNNVTGISYGNVENVDTSFIFDIVSNVNKYSDNEKPVFLNVHSSILAEDVMELVKEDVTQGAMGIYDSIGMTFSKQEALGDFGDANMGKRALIVNQFVRSMIALTATTHSIVFLINHLAPNLGGMGFTLPGGRGQEYGSHTIIRINKGKYNKPEKGIYSVELTTQKARYGVKGEKRTLIINGGKGIHVTASTILFAASLGVVTGTNASLSFGDKSIGRLSSVALKDEDFDLVNDLEKKIIKVLDVPN